MGSYRDDYPSGGASAAAAHHYLGAHSLGDSVYGYDNLYASGDAGHTPVFFALHSNGLVSELHTRTLLVEHGNVGISAGVHSHSRRRNVDPYSQTLLTDSQAFGSHTWASYAQSSYSGVRSSGAHPYSNTPDAFMPLERQAENNPPGSLQALNSAAESKKTTPSLDALIKETWELHSLFRAGLAADLKKSKRSGNGTEDIMRRWKRDRQMPLKGDVLDIEMKWEDASLVKEEIPSSWKELDAPYKETKEVFSNKKQKDLSNMKQEQYASNVQRFTCERVVEFMHNSSDDHTSDDESFVDSDDDGPNVYAKSSPKVKSREEQAYEFFLQMFEENKDLKKLYNEQCHVGKFDCLVCSSIPGKPRKIYNGLISVIMHASKIIKTKKKQEHRGYARAVCSALGWDICRLPTIPLGSSPHPRCCIPADEEQNTEAEEIEAALKESENDESGAPDSEENSVGEENKPED